MSGQLDVQRRPAWLFWGSLLLFPCITFLKVGTVVGAHIWPASTVKLIKGKVFETVYQQFWMINNH